MFKQQVERALSFEDKGDAGSTVADCADHPVLPCGGCLGVCFTASCHFSNRLFCFSLAVEKEGSRFELSVRLCVRVSVAGVRAPLLPRFGVNSPRCATTALHLRTLFVHVHAHLQTHPVACGIAIELLLLAPGASIRFHPRPDVCAACRSSQMADRR